MYNTNYEKPRPIKQQILKIGQLFGLDTKLALEFAKTLPAHPVDTDGYFAIPRWKKIFSEELSYHQAVERVIQKIYTKQFAFAKIEAKSNSNISLNGLKQTRRTIDSWDQIESQQKNSDILIIAAKLMGYRDRSVVGVYEKMRTKEFGLGTFGICIIILTHPELFRKTHSTSNVSFSCIGDTYPPFNQRGCDLCPSSMPCYNVLRIFIDHQFSLSALYCRQDSPNFYSPPYKNPGLNYNFVPTGFLE